MTIDRNELFDQCKKVHKSFHEWPTWINQTLTRIILNEKYNKAQNSMMAMKDSCEVQKTMVINRNSRMVSPNASMTNLTLNT